MAQQFHLRHVPKSIQGAPYIYVHGIFHNTQKVETILHVQRLMNEYTKAVYTCMQDGKFWQMLQMDEPGRHNAKCSEPVTTEQLLYDSTYMSYLEEWKSRRQSSMVVSRDWGEEGLGVSVDRVSLVHDKNVLEMDLNN